MKKYHDIASIKVSGDSLSMIIDGKSYHFKFANISSGLANATQTEREKFEVSPSGYGISWPLLDEDLSIDGLLGIQHEIPEQLKITS